MTKKNVLVLCTGNSARSQMAEGIINHLLAGSWRAVSAGTKPVGYVHPLAIYVMSELGIDIAGHHSKSTDEFRGQRFDQIITVCDNAAGEACPFWPGKPVSAHWGVPDPAAVEGSEEQRLKAFKDAALILRRRIELFLSLPLQRLDAMSLQRELRNIGQE